MIISINELNEKYTNTAGEKAVNLSKLYSLGYCIPRGSILLNTAYMRFISETGLMNKIKMELSRRNIDNMRWEELWDASLRIRNLFLTTPFPKDLYRELRQKLLIYEGTVVAVRSSAPGEDSLKSSFAGLHESFINISGVDSIINHIRLVWASLWSDKALLYRNELGLDVYQSSMAVIVQEMINGDVSGLGFSINPSGKDEVVIEAVRGLNQFLVDGKVDPERWILSRENCNVLDYKRGESPYNEKILSKRRLNDVFSAIIKINFSYGIPVDIEWTIKNDTLFLLQVRPITTVKDSDKNEKPWTKEDKRPWYKSLTKSFASMQKLRRHIEEEILPGMQTAASTIRKIDPNLLSTKDLSDEIIRRYCIYEKWRNVYWEELIPFAHGIRLFGQLYNDTVKPKDPYEFTQLLSSQSMLSVTRNGYFASLIELIRNDRKLYNIIQNKDYENLSLDFKDLLTGFLEVYGNAMFEGRPIFKNRKKLLSWLLKTADSNYHYKSSDKNNSREFLEKKFIEFFDENQKNAVADVIDLARASWKLRDDDNIYLADLESALYEAVDIGVHSLKESHKLKFDEKNPEVIAELLKGIEINASDRVEVEYEEPIEKDILNKNIMKNLKVEDSEYIMRVRKYTGQPASPGIAVGISRVISIPDDLFDFKEGEVLICDSIDPNMTFIVPFASAIVERRGGMLIHGAIIAREYGIPCVTGIENATQLIKDGSTVIVDGYLGIVTIKEG